MLSIPKILEKKLDGSSLTNDEIEHFIKSLHEEKVHMAQVGAFLSSVKILGMTMEETSQLTRCMVQYSDKLKWPDEWKSILVDKHSTGGVGDKISLVLAPLLAACGAKVPMISGRGLGITGGTIDKLESIKGYCAELDQSQTLNLLEKVGCFIGGQSKEMVPTDKILYSIRDITGTVMSKPLITASIISKKAVENISHLMLDVKYGEAAVNKTFEIAEELAKSMISVGESNNIKTVAVISDMSNPLGNALGYAVEIAETLRCLNGNFPDDIKELVFSQASHLIQSIKTVSSKQEAEILFDKMISSGEALKKFKEMLIGQKVTEELANKLCEKCDRSIDEYLEILGHVPKCKAEFKANKSGYIFHQSAFNIGTVIWSLGGGRTVPTDNINFNVGVVLKKCRGDKINKGDTWAVVYHDSGELNQTLADYMEKAIEIQDEPLKKKSLIAKFVTIRDCE